MGSSFYFELPVYVSEASLKGATYLLPGTESSEEVVQTSNHSSYRNLQPINIEIGKIPKSSCSLDANNASSVLDHQIMHSKSTNHRQLYSHSDSSQLYAINSESSWNGSLSFYFLGRPPSPSICCIIMYQVYLAEKRKCFRFQRMSRIILNRSICVSSSWYLGGIFHLSFYFGLLGYLYRMIRI